MSVCCTAGDDDVSASARFLSEKFKETEHFETDKFQSCHHEIEIKRQHRGIQQQTDRNVLCQISVCWISDSSEC